MALKDTLTKVHDLFEELNKLRPISPEQEKRIMQKFRLDWNFNSNHLEGNQLDYGETKALILFGITAQGKPLKDHIEIQGHDEALKYIIEIIKQGRPMTEQFIRELHIMIIKQPYQVDAVTPTGEPTKKWINIGQYKSMPNHVLTKTGEIFYFASPEETPAKMHDLMSWYQEAFNNKDTDAVLLAAEFHYRFVRIHPFDDGNGRMARILMNFILMQRDFPPVIIKADKKEEYFSALQQADSGNLEVFFNYIGNQLIQSLQLMIKGARGESIDELDDLDKEIALLKARMQTKDKLVEKSREALINHYKNVLVPLMKKAEQKLSQFDELFQKKEFEFHVENYGRRGSAESALSYRAILEQENVKLDITTLIGEYTWSGFKRDGANTFNVGTRFEIDLDTYRWILKFPQTNNIEYKKLYTDLLTEDEINECVSFLVKSILQQIRSNTGIKE